MAVVTFNLAAEMFDPFVWYGNVYFANKNLIGLSNGIYSGIYSGTFSYKNGGLSGGTVKSYTNYINGTADYSVSGISYSAKKINSYLNAGDAIGLHSDVLKGNDLLNGSVFSDQIIGWNGNDRIFGNGGDDSLVGGLGKDTLVGGTGADMFVLGAFGSSELRAVDSISDFKRADGDKIVLSLSAFSVNVGILDPSFFVSGNKAADSLDRIIVDGSKVFYDADGTGRGKAVQIAVVTVVGSGPLQADDFFGF